MNKICRCLILSSFFALTGCGPLHLGVKESQINTEQYANAKEFLKNQNLVAKGISESELLKLLEDQKVQKLTQINKAADIQADLFGTITPHADKKDIEGISEWIVSHHVFNLSYKDVRTEFYFDWIPISYNLLEFGPDLNILFITKRDENNPSSPYVLTRTIVTGTENGRSKEREYVWSALFSIITEAGKKLLF
jgi:hypothetical protein